jgi:hypothetical protein
MSETVELLNGEMMNDDLANWVGDGLETLIGVLGVLEQQRRSIEVFFGNAIGLVFIRGTALFLRSVELWMSSNCEHSSVQSVECSSAA